LIIAIDGPAGSGKSTTARAVARAMAYAHLDTGAMYRTAALALHLKGFKTDSSESAGILENAVIEIAPDDGATIVHLDGHDVSSTIRTPEIGTMASQVATLPALRGKLVDQQRRIIGKLEEEYGGVVIEGRDIGTVVVPGADFKFFMTASVEIRAQRRVRQLADQGQQVSLDDTIAGILERDNRDVNRSESPLREAEDAITVDTTTMSVDDQVLFIVNQINQID